MNRDDFVCATCKGLKVVRDVSYRWCSECGCGRPFVPPTAAKAEPAKPVADSGTRNCLWPGCKVKVNPAMYACKKHWFMYPAAIRSQILAAYTMGQEDDLTLVSKDWQAAHKAAQAWVVSAGLAPT